MVKIKKAPEFRFVPLDIETRKKIYDARNKLNVKGAELQDQIGEICEIAIELYNEKAELLTHVKNVKNGLEKIFEFFRESFSEEEYIELEVVKELNLIYKNSLNLIKENEK